MPSIDKVGRHFPLTIAAELSHILGHCFQFFQPRKWYAALEQAALTSLDFCERELGNWWQSSSFKEDHHKTLSLPTVNSLVGVFEDASRDVFNTIGLGKSIGWKVDFGIDKRLVSRIQRKRSILCR